MPYKQAESAQYTSCKDEVMTTDVIKCNNCGHPVCPICRRGSAMDDTYCDECCELLNIKRSWFI